MRQHDLFLVLKFMQITLKQTWNSQSKEKNNEKEKNQVLIAKI